MITTKKLELSEDILYTESGDLTEKTDKVFCECANTLQESLDSPMHIMCSIANLVMKYKDDIEALSAIQAWLDEQISIFQMENYIDDCFNDDVNDYYYFKGCIVDILQKLEDILFLEFVKIERS